ncbi:uncharacterized protein LOC111387456 [Olea europaea var. sylvestris]|uniref:uncharacterized protein LOC111387456 n=1 Tax=Olea europaea var. sylvestris TaxID=158386 RepID=UPI000C1CFDFD|nr:uncharacterized protein LOC111387456 [Olea europaea var. sylvestris]
MQTKGIHDPSSGYKPLVNTCSPYNNSRSWSMKSQEVPLSVVASFNKIKNVISGVPQLASILRSSKKLVVSEDGKKVRRQHPLTESDMDELQVSHTLDSFILLPCRMNLVRLLPCPKYVYIQFFC